jgi:Rps23 Pro-64 3,4-dihydroxylase Tpa1-like proline 4-hydroxylase
MTSKINIEYLKTLNDKACKEHFGDWTNDIKSLHQQYISAEPFEHIIIPNFLNEKYANEIANKFPLDFDNWHKYHNPIEVKYANDNINAMDEDIKRLFYILCTDEITDIFSQMSGIENLQYDPHMHGSGLHAHPRNGRLHLHLDYEKHPLMNKERRLNIILYLSKDWKEEWNGHTELWNKDVSQCMKKSPVVFNTAIVFKTNEISWHGLPEKIKCPIGEYRKSLAFYYVSDMVSEKSEQKIGNDGSGYRTKATFVKRPEDPDYEQMKKLYALRPSRRIEQRDLDEIWQDWNEELF